MVSIWAAVIAGLAGVSGALLTNFLSLLGNKQAFRQRLESERIAYEREQQEKKRERIRLAGIELMQTTRVAFFALEEVGRVSRYTSYTDPSQWKKDIARLATQLRSSTASINNN